jgi:predicted DNA-binding transcriptional regulator YafY
MAIYTPNDPLAQALDVSVRTMQRYINMLDEMSIPIYSDD